MRRTFWQFSAAILVAGPWIVSCSPTTRFTDIWVDPGSGKFTAQKVLVSMITNDENMRRVAEDELCSKMTKRQGIPSYTLFTPDQLKDIEYAKTKVKELGIEGAVTMRIVGVEEKTTYVPGSYVSAPYDPRPYWGYYSYGYGVVYEPGYTETNKYVLVETNIYNITTEKLVWSGRSETMNPESVRGMIDEIAAEAAIVLKEQGKID
jgi:hypothetical protein